MTNPDSAVGTNAGYNGRTSTKAFNDDLGAFSRGVVSGWTCAPKTGMTVELGGDGSNRDVAVAEDNAGNRTTINNTSGAPVPITLEASPASGSRYDLVVAYVENPAQGSGSTDVDFTTQVGFIAVKGTASGTPSVPNDTAIRTAITADGATGASAYYVILAKILVGTNVSTIGSGVITQGDAAQTTIPAGSGTVGTDALNNAVVTPAKISYSTESTSEQAVGTWTDGKTIYKKTFTGTYNASANTTNSVFTFSGVSDIIDAKGWVSNVDAKVAFGMAHRNGTGVISDSGALLTGTTVIIRSFNNAAGSNLPYAITLYYTKSA